jgi:hypothetical protein
MNQPHPDGRAFWLEAVGASRLARLAREAGRWLAAAILAGIPLLFLNLGWQREADRLRQREQEEGERVLRLLHNRLLTQAGLEGTLSLALDTLHCLCRGRPDGTAILTTWLDRLRQDFPGVFETAIFAPDGQLLIDRSDLPEFHPALASFGRDMRTFLDGDSQPLERNLPAYRPFLGPFRKGQARHLQSLATVLSSLSRRRALSYAQGCQKGDPWFLAWVTIPEDPIALDLRLRQWWLLLERPDGSTRAAALDLRQPLLPQLASLGPAARGAERALAVLGDDEDRIIALDDHLWTQVLGSRQHRLLLCHPDPGGVAWRQTVARVRGWLLIAFLVSLSGVRWLLGRGAGLSLRWRLTALFLYCAAIPLGLLGLAAQSLLSDREAALVRQRFLIQEAILQETARRHVEQLGVIETRLRRTFQPAVPAGEAGPRRATALMQALTRRLLPSYAAVIDTEGRVLFQRLEGFQDTLGPLIPYLALQSRRRLAEINGETIPPALATREQAVLASMETFGLNLAEVGAMLEGSGERFVPFRMGKSAAYILLALVRNVTGRAVASAQFLLGRDRFRDRLPALLRALQQRLPEGQLVGGYPWGPPGATEAALLPLTDEVSSAIDRWGVPAHRVLGARDRVYLISGLFSPALHSQKVFIVSDDARLRADLAATRRRLALLGAALALLGAALGWLVGGTFLRPIAEFTTGLAAIQERRFDHRLAIEGNDEFGQLGGLFNDVIAGLADLEVASIVQDTFLPQSPLSDAGWEISGATRCASRVGGDYYDYFPRPDGRWVLVVGDVTGHGVAAALGVAVAKAAFTHPANPASPAALLDLMNRLVGSTLAGSRAITCFLAVFDPRDGRLVAANAGHPFPFLIRRSPPRPSATANTGTLTGAIDPDHHIEELQLRHPPLGFATRRPFEEREWRLGPEDWVCFYTDGLIEAPDPYGLPLGFDRCRAILPGCRRASAVATREAIAAWHRQAMGPAGPTDDITLLVLQGSQRPSPPSA